MNTNHIQFRYEIVIVMIENNQEIGAIDLESSSKRRPEVVMSQPIDWS
jgi:putative methionine-R-sulfoxide reductase with GAF domain